MKVLLTGYEGSKKILTASSYLLNKYLPGFDVYFLNYGSFQEKLYCGQFVSLDEKQFHGHKAWGGYLRKYLMTLDDELVILAMDDFFLVKPYDEVEYGKLLEDMKTYSVGLMKAGEDKKRYTSSCNYIVWNRKLLLDILVKAHISSAWRFETRALRSAKMWGEKMTWRPVVTYNHLASLSGKRNPGKVAVGDNSKEDVEFLVANDYLKEEDLIMEHGKGLAIKYEL